ncbi:unnamed protein product [Calicophoron daubneyi]|uniref:TLC domain-containing protein n=1 Tax=Calicophoron daubneyi TaxID=300641 RepID=A0AAV2U0E2_CALDB
MPLYEQNVEAMMNSAFSPQITVVLAFILFYCIDFGLKSFASLSKVRNKDAYELTRLRNYTLSVVHAFAAGIYSLYCLIVSRDLLGDMISAESEAAYHLLGFSTGYFIHDVYHNVCCRICLRSIEIILHHVAVVLCFVVVMECRILVLYAIFGLLMELNSIFLHARQIMLHLGVDPQSFVYRINASINVASFIVFRLILGGFLYTWAIANRHRIPYVIALILIGSFTLFILMNFVLFWRVLASDRRILNDRQLFKAKEKSWTRGWTTLNHGS